MSIRTKLLIFALSISLIPISIITTLFYFHTKSTIERQTLNWLMAVAESKKNLTLSFLDSKKGRVIDFSSDGFIRDSLETISRIGKQNRDISRLNRHLKENKLSLDHQITSIAVLDINGTVVASTTDKWMGMEMSKDELFINCVSKGDAETYIGKSYNATSLDVNCICISSPLTNKNDDTTIGVIVVAYDIAILEEITNQRTGMGASGEALLGMKKEDSVLFLTSLKYTSDTPMTKYIPLTSLQAEPMRLALQGQDGAIIAPDYRGVAVVAAYQYIPGVDWGLVTKIDKKEVFAPIARIRNFIFILVSIIVIAVVVVTIFISRRLIRPIQKLVEGTGKIAAGSLDFKISTKSKDEIGDLANSFNNMTTQLGESKRQLDDYALNLKQMVEEKTKEIKIMLNELTYKNKEMEQIIYVTSHDLRSPLLNIQGFSKELEQSLKQMRSILNDNDIPAEVREKFADILEGDIPDALRFILASSSKMDSLLSGLLHLSRMSRVNLATEQLDMNRLISDVIATHEYKIKETKTTCQVEELPSCSGDEVQINQVFSNLLDNALKYLDSDRKGIIRISGRSDNRRTIYCLEDNGIGIEEKQQEKVFEIFHRLNPCDSVIGDGLGLAIVQQILSRHGGKVWVESESGKGSKFFVQMSK